MKVQMVKGPVFKIVGNGMISIPELAEGRLIPAVIIDTLDNQVIPDLFEIHKSTPPGDTASTWTKRFFENNRVILQLDFSQPIKVSFGVEFNLVKHYSLVDGIVQSKGLLLIAGKPGDKVSGTIADGVIIEVPNTGFEVSWESTLLRVLKGIYKKERLSKKDSSTIAKDHIRTMREVWNLRRDD